MSKRKDRRKGAELYEAVVHSAGNGDVAALSAPPEPRPLMRKFRFQLLHRWMVEHLTPCRVADVGGGKGLLAYLLRRSGWDAVVIDPMPQPLPAKYRNLVTGEQAHIPETESVPRFSASFAQEMAQGFDLLVAMHAHGCIVRVIDAVAQYGCSAIVMPCCVIDEPLTPAPGVHWLQCVVDYAVARGCTVQAFRLNFKGQNIGLYVRRPTSAAAAPHKDAA